MRAVVQRVLDSSVEVDGSIIASIKAGILALVGFYRDDADGDLEYIADKIISLRIFHDPGGVMNLALPDINGELLIVSQFTLYGDARRGRRPSYSDAMNPKDAAALYGRFIEKCAEKYERVKSGIFGADMRVCLTNSGPVTILLDSGKMF